MAGAKIHRATGAGERTDRLRGVVERERAAVDSERTTGSAEGGTAVDREIAGGDHGATSVGVSGVAKDELARA